MVVGISIQGYDENVSHNSINNIYTREEGDAPNYVKNPSQKIIRWHCYKCLHIDLLLSAINSFKESNVQNKPGKASRISSTTHFSFVI